MTINNIKALADFKESHPNAEKSIDAWQSEVARAEWQTPNQLKDQYGNASILKSRNVVFNIGGNRYRLWAQISYKLGIVFVKAIGTHEEYNGWKIR